MLALKFKTFCSLLKFPRMYPDSNFFNWGKKLQKGQDHCEAGSRN